MPDNTSKPGAVVKAVKELTPEQKKLNAASDKFHKDWKKETFGILDHAEHTDQTVSSFIFQRIQEASSLKAAENAFEAIERDWRDAHKYTVTQTVGTNVGTEIEVRPPVPRSWSTQKSRIFKLCREASEIAKKASAASVMFKAQKKMKMDPKALREMYRLDGDDPLSYRADDYAGDDGLAAFSSDVRDVKSFLTSFGDGNTKGAIGARNAAAIKRLPEQVLNALSKFQKSVADAVAAGMNQEKLEKAILSASTQLDKTTVKLLADKRDAKLAAQATDAKATAKAARKLPEPVAAEVAKTA